VFARASPFGICRVRALLEGGEDDVHRRTSFAASTELSTSQDFREGDLLGFFALKMFLDALVGVVFFEFFGED
tara:strand:- start:522 stop:740 length:219 start_codon:yes stop_codon:yes gene_type:complete